jgi:hypothetical protein
VRFWNGIVEATLLADASTCFPFFGFDYNSLAFSISLVLFVHCPFSVFYFFDIVPLFPFDVPLSVEFFYFPF